MDADVDVSNSENHIECAQSTSRASGASKSIRKNKTLITNDKAASSNDSNTNTDEPILIEDEPLNLTFTNCDDEPLDLSIKNPK